MADEVPVFPKAGSVLFHSGNIVNWNRLKKKPLQKTQDELSESITNTLNAWLTDIDKNVIQYATELECANAKFVETLPNTELDKLKVTAKVFLTKCDPDIVDEAISTVCKVLGDLPQLDSVLVSFPDDVTLLTLDDLRPVWERLEQLVEENKVLSLGVCDLSTTQLEELHNWAKEKPATNQVNLASCCVMPEEMVEFAKANDIQLLTHNDPKEMISNEAFQSILSLSASQRDGLNWEVSWIVRYSALVKCRGIIKTKGYLCKALRDIKVRP